MGKQKDQRAYQPEPEFRQSLVRKCFTICPERPRRKSKYQQAGKRNTSLEDKRGKIVLSLRTTKGSYYCQYQAKFASVAEPNKDSLDI